MGQDAATSVVVERAGAVAHLVLNRPDKRNALNGAMWQKLADAVGDLKDDRTIRAVIVRGTDATAFAAGADIDELAAVYADEGAGAAYSRLMQTAQDRLARLPVPTIAQIAGPCMGAGCGIALCCDMRIADETARFSIPPARLGLVYGLAETRRLIAAVGISEAKRMLFTAAVVEPEAALRSGLIDQLVPGAELAAHVAALAERIAALSPHTMRATKHVFGLIADGATEESNATRTMFDAAFRGSDFSEGRAAFKDRRKPRFQS